LIIAVLSINTNSFCGGRSIKGIVPSVTNGNLYTGIAHIEINAVCTLNINRVTAFSTFNDSVVTIYIEAVISFATS